MQFESFGGDPVVRAIVDAQLRLSQARTTSELSYELAVRLRDLAPITHAASLDVKDLPPGRFRVRYAFDLRAMTFSPRAIAEGSRWDGCPDDLPVHACDALAPLLGMREPVLARGARDSGWSRGVMPAEFDAVCVPVYAGGAVCEWIVLPLEPGSEVSPSVAPVLLSSVNSHARIVQQLRLSARLSETAEELDRQLRRAGALQRSILPEAPERIDGVSFATRYTPCHAAGGDYYDFRRFADGRIGCMIADVSGHGVDAAVVMGMIRAAMTAYRLAELPAIGTARHLNRIMHDTLPSGMFVTAQFVLLDPRDWTGLTLVAGHPPARMRRADGRVEPLGDAAMIPLGIEREIPEGGHVPFGLGPGDAVVLYTDGVTEARSRGGALFGAEGLDAALASAGCNAHAILEAVERAVDAHTDGQPPEDDRCLVVIRREA